jgi:hypothetical protein
MSGLAHTSDILDSAGPSGISFDRVPGRILLAAAELAFSSAPRMPSSVESAATGDFGPSWSSAMGGGLGSLGELEGDIVPILMF